MWLLKAAFYSTKKSFPQLMYICWFVISRLSRKVQNSYCSVQNVQDKRALYKGALSLNFVHGKRQASLVQELKTRSTYVQPRANVLNNLYTAVRILH